MRIAVLLAFGLLTTSAGAQEGWWMKEPIRWVQTNLRQTDAGLDAARLMDGANPNQADENGWTPLMAATAHNDYEIAKTLAERGADVNARDHPGYTALRIASLQQSGTIVNILKQHGAK